jgi:DNA-binding response OmpR family regulator
MAKDRVLVVDPDEWVARLLAAGLRDHGFEVSTCFTAGTALTAAKAISPRCVVTEMVLPEMDGPSFVRTLRREPPPLGRIPLVFLTNAEDMVSRNAAFQAGADLYLSKPFRVDEIALQLQALIAMATRLSSSSDSPPLLDIELEETPESVAPGEHAIEGNIAEMSVATVLTLLEMEHRSGTLKMTHNKRTCCLDMIGGFAIGGTITGSSVSPLAVLREVLRWKQGRFRFRPGTDSATPANRRSIGALLLEAVRLDDESTHEMDEAPTMKRGALASRQSSPPNTRRNAPVPSSRRVSRPPQPALRPPSRPPSAPTGTATSAIKKPPPPPIRPLVPRPLADTSSIVTGTKKE